MPSYNHELVTHFPSTETIMSPSAGPHEFLLESLGHFLKVLQFRGRGEGEKSGT